MSLMVNLHSITFLTHAPKTVLNCVRHFIAEAILVILVNGSFHLVDSHFSTLKIFAGLNAVVLSGVDQNVDKLFRIES